MLHLVLAFQWWRRHSQSFVEAKEARDTWNKGMQQNYEDTSRDTGKAVETGSIIYDT